MIDSAWSTTFTGLSARSDRETLVELITRVSALVEVVPELRELDLNPVKGSSLAGAWSSLMPECGWDVPLTRVRAADASSP